MSDWNDIESLWRSNEPPEIGDLNRRLRRQTRLIRLWFASEVAIGAVGLSIGGWFIFGQAMPVLGLSIVAFALFALNRSWDAWRGAFSVETGTPADTIASALIRNASFKRYLRANYVVSVAAAALICAMIVLDSFGPPDDPTRHERALVAVAIGFTAIIIWMAGCGLYAERLTRERERLLALKRALGLDA